MVGCSNVPTSSVLVYPGILVAVIHFFSRGCWQNLCGFQATGRVEEGSRRGQEKRPTCKLAKNREIDVASVFFLRTNRSPSFKTNNVRYSCVGLEFFVPVGASLFALVLRVPDKTM